MSILSFNDLSQSFGDFDLFTNASGSLDNQARVGLVGPNGIGKSTLLKQLVGINKPETGELHLARNARIGYLRQEAMLAFRGREENTVYEEMQLVFEHIHAQADELQALESKMASGDTSEQTLTAYSQAQEAFEAAGGYDYEVRIQQVLDGLGFARDNWSTALSHLSGGQKTRALLARLLLEEPDLLVLDEPTNHLDIAAVEWLESRLNIWKGAVLIVSHDRYFLDKVANTIWEMSATGIDTYRGNYTAYTQQREERWERKKKELATEQERLLKEMDYIRKHIASQNTAQAKGKLKRLNAQLGLTGAVKLWQTEERLKAFTSQRVSAGPRKFNLRLNSSHRSGNIVLRTKDLIIGYPTKTLFSAEDIELTRLECAALIGPNGSGKSTFLKTVLGNLEPIDGDTKLGASLEIGYFSQAHDSLKLDHSVLDELLSHKQMDISEARNYLGQYMFRGDDVYKRVSALSGGERGRLALAILALQNANFLLLDEPTNHLDIPAQELLQSVLERFDGTILMVSHDRYLIDQLATQIWSVEPEKGRLDVFSGSYADYLAAREAARLAEADAKAAAAAEKPKAPSKAASQKRSISKNEMRKLEEGIARIEAEIEATETALAEASDALQAASEAQDFDKIQAASLEYSQLEEKIESLMLEWEEIEEKHSQATTTQ